MTGPDQLRAISTLLKREPAWSEAGKVLVEGQEEGPSIHLGVFVQPYLDYILQGRKTVESRFSAMRIAPYGAVARGDLVLCKVSGGPVVGICEIGAAWSYRLDPDTWRVLRREFTAALCAEDPEFWHSRQRAVYATLMYVTRAMRVPALSWPKRDRRGWVVVRPTSRLHSGGAGMRTTVLGVSGGIASGKSTVSAAVAQALGCSRVSFGGYVRSEALRRGRTLDRESLQEIGAALIASDAQGFCRDVLSQSDWRAGQPLVVDGVRHVTVVNALRELVSPFDFRLLYIDAPATARLARLSSRGEEADHLGHYESHSTEGDVGMALRQLADRVVDGSKPIESVIDEVVSWAALLE